jgi:hypothetical protein
MMRGACDVAIAPSAPQHQMDRRIAIARIGAFLAAALTGTRAMANNEGIDGDAADHRIRQWTDRARQRPDETERNQTLARAEAALARSETEQASLLFEQAGFVRHAADAELGLTRAYMQGGQYRRALAFASHTAGAHPDTSAGAGLYAWLLHLGGQTQFAARVLAQAKERLVGDPLLTDVTALIEARNPAPQGRLLDAPGRFAPFGEPHSSPGEASRVVASGVLIDDGRRVLTGRLPGAAQGVGFFVRNGLGQLRSVGRVVDAAAVGISILELQSPIAVGRAALPPRDPFPGTPAFAFDFSTTATTPMWPQLHSGFLGRPQQAAGTYRLGVVRRGGAHGGPVFDIAGRLIGVSGVDESGHDIITLISLARKQLGALAGHTAENADRMAMDALYERGLGLSVQVLGSRPLPS